ncbi:MAG: hypothetical protein IPI66_11865 [Chitinophagaceae bacterium]|nr:hypothetical protein [Chitinophagaceae bacterium]MBL0056155.1 hypothetical protein [Chitinophagaceae bacterium]
MKKAVPIKKSNRPRLLKNEPDWPPYNSPRTIPVLKDFTYAEFRKIADKTPFTQAEWAAMLHVSERTLQRYAKTNGQFAPINAERAMQIDRLLKEARQTFGKLEVFYHWIKNNPQMLGGKLSFESLTSAHGIERVLTQLHRIQHGLFA